MTDNMAMQQWPTPDMQMQMMNHMAMCGIDPDWDMAQMVMDGTWCDGDTHTWDDMMAMDKDTMQMAVWCGG